MKKTDFNPKDAIVDLVITYTDDTHKVLKNISLGDVIEAVDFITVTKMHPDQGKIITHRFNMSHIKEYAFHLTERKTNNGLA